MTVHEQIEYHCPDCGSITPIMPGIMACFGCKKPLTLIAINAPTCDKVGCEARATHQAEVVLYAAVARVHPPAVGTLGIRVCEAHATKEAARELLSDEGKRQIERGFTQAGRAKPDWKRSFIRWKKL
jgi:hypothetical protein